MLARLKNKLNKAAAIDEEKLLNDILASDSITRQIIDLNQDQLYNQGVQSDGSPTGEYHLTTVRKKLAFGDSWNTPGRVDHITGNDTGITYNSMRVKADNGGIRITADDRNNFFEREPKGLGLTKESIQEIIPEIKETLREKIREQILS